jgi:hypothetical protein
MVHDLPTAAPIPEVRGANPFRTVAAVQGLYFLLTGIWPLLHIDSFQAVTGRKMDLWLVYTVGSLVGVIGLALLTAAGTRRVTTEVMILAIGSALALAAIDVIFVARGVISWVYLLDAVAEVGLVGWWMLTHVGMPVRQAPAPQYPHVQALLTRGQSVSPNGPARS